MAKLGAAEQQATLVWVITGLVLFLTPTLAIVGVGLEFRAGFGSPGTTEGFTPGATPPPEEATGTPWFVAAALVGIVGSLVGIAYTTRTGQLVARVLLIIVVVGTVLVAAPALLKPNPQTSVPEGPRYCQEHSGGDTTCPGG
jgi:hypothetical protein